MKRRDFIKLAGAASAQVFLGQTLLSTLGVQRASADTGLAIESLQRRLSGGKNMIFLPSTPGYAAANLSFNIRTQIAPKVRVVVANAEAVQDTIRWALDNGLRFALRSGGHSYEGFSQSPDVVIDVRGMNNVTLSDDKNSVVAGSGSPLGRVYKVLNNAGMIIPAGSCFPVGVAGHTLGGGFGLMARAFGLACDSVTEIEMVDANGQIFKASDNSNQDLFWALKGGGNGSFGVVTSFKFRPTRIAKYVYRIKLVWQAPIAQAVKVAMAWQQWLEKLDSSITCTMHMGSFKNGEAVIRVSGLCVSSAEAARHSDPEAVAANAMKDLVRLVQSFTRPRALEPTDRLLKKMTFLEAAHLFNGIDGMTLTDDRSEGLFNAKGSGARSLFINEYEAVHMKAKSDYVKDPMSERGFETLLNSLKSSREPIAVMADSYGGAINRIPSDQTAFAHRGNTRYVMQYYRQWMSASSTPAILEAMRSVYNPMRPFVSGGCYVNYPDLDLGAGYAKAYWGENLPRLMKLKSIYDPKNVFRHAQSVPLP